MRERSKDPSVLRMITVLSVHEFVFPFLHRILEAAGKGSTRIDNQPDPRGIVSYDQQPLPQIFRRYFAPRNGNIRGHVLENGGFLPSFL